jgi:hypothetical protein
MRSALINEFGDASVRRKAFAPTEARYQALLAEIKGWHDADAAELASSEKTDRYQIDISARSSESTINLKAAHKAMGLAAFLRACGMTLKALRAALAPAEAEKLVSVALTGSRSVTATALVTAPRAAALEREAA